MPSLHYRQVGSGKPLVLLHGFLETHAIWNDFVTPLSKKFSVITVDLPGFGKSELLPLPLTISSVATHVLNTLAGITSEPVCVIGHSLGGYVTLAMVEQASEKFRSFGLFHSTAAADTPEKKESRTKTIDFVTRNGALAFTSNFIPPLFADPKHPAIPVVTNLATQTAEKTITAYLAAMRDRPERLSVLETFNGPTLFIAGRQDTVIPVESLQKQSKLAKKPTVQVLENVGHMGMFEAFDQSITSVSDFASCI